MTIVGRLTKDAVVKQLKDEREVVNFSIAVNDYYKPRNGERARIATYYNCSFWINSKIAANLKKGSIVEITGRIYVTAYNSPDGTVKASLNCHVNSIKLHTWPKQVGGIETSHQRAVTEEEGEDLPF